MKLFKRVVLNIFSFIHYLGCSHTGSILSLPCKPKTDTEDLMSCFSDVSNTKSKEKLERKHLSEVMY